MKQILYISLVVNLLACTKDNFCYECQLIDLDTGNAVDTSFACASGAAEAQQNAKSLINMNHPAVWGDSVINVQCELED